MRIEAVYRNGGVYMDTDMVCLRPIDPVIKDTKAFVVRETSEFLGNAVFGSAPKNKLLKPILDCFKDMSFPRTGPQNKKTGPHLFTRLANTSGEARELGSKSFFPVPFSRRKEIDSGIVDLSDTEIYAIHQWSHSWKGQ
jgi:mannosyltransferase OCH1-like enzyme